MSKMMIGWVAVIVGVAGLWFIVASPSSAADATSQPAGLPGAGLSTAAPTTVPVVDLKAGWSALQEGQAVGTIEQDAKHPTNTNPHLLRIAVTKTADPGEGRAGAVNANQFAVANDQWFDVTFTASTERGSVGLVFSLENGDGKVLARTTLPEIGRGRMGGRRGGGAPATAPGAAPAPWSKYLVSLHTRAADPNVHLIITPIEPTNIWLDGLTIVLRPAGQYQRKIPGDEMKWNRAALKKSDLKTQWNGDAHENANAGNCRYWPPGNIRGGDGCRADVPTAERQCCPG